MGTAIDGDVHRKTQPTGDRSRLAHEARMLGAIRHPGVVTLAAEPVDQPDVLLLGLLPGGDLRGRRFPSTEVAGLGAAIATTLADLHDLGVVHGACSTEHILLAEDGAPVLCSFGQARFGLGDRELAAAQRSDVQALTGALLEILDDDRAPLHRLLQRAGGRRHSSARSLAQALAGVPGARLPRRPVEGLAPLYPLDTAELPAVAEQRTNDGIPPGPAGRRPPRAVLHRRALIATAAGALVLVGVVLSTGPGGRPAAQAAIRSSGCPPVDAGCRPVATADGVLTTPAGRWSLGETGDIVVLGRWACTPVALPALLSPRTGQVWVFDEWADRSGDVAARLIARMPGSTSLAVVAGSDGCDKLQVVGPAGHRNTLDPGDSP